MVGGPTTQNGCADADQLAGRGNCPVIGRSPSTDTAGDPGHVTLTLAEADVPLRLDEDPRQDQIAISDESPVVALLAGLVNGGAEPTVLNDGIQAVESLNRG